MDIFRAVLDGIAMSAVFSGASAVLALIDPRFFFDTHPKAIQKAAPLQMTKAEHFLFWPFIMIPLFAAAQAGIVMLLRLIN